MSNQTKNPYASSLDGLVLEDPVEAFFAFCKEREAIRIRRESGAPAPWSTDPIFQQGRFLNVFREDDRASRAILGFAKPLQDNLPDLIQALFFARWCNRQISLDALSPELLQDERALTEALHSLPAPWCNVTAYPVEPVKWKDRVFSRWESATHLFRVIKEDLAHLIQAANGDVMRATRSVNERFEMANDFPIFMAVMDIAWFRPDVIHPSSPVPTGIGAAPFLDRLQNHLDLESHQETCREIIRLQETYWPEARRALQPIDVEYLSCECRKYWSYKNETKRFEGKNRFRQGQDPLVEFDLPNPLPAELQTQIHVIAGGPCSGKTTLIEALKAEGFSVFPESSRVLLEEGKARGQSAEEMRFDPIEWQRTVCEKDHALFSNIDPQEPVFTDTSFLENLVFSDQAGLVMGPNIQRWLKQHRYKTVFFLAPVESSETDESRLESSHTAAQISTQVWGRYLEFGYQPVILPAERTEQRIARIRALLDATH